MADKEQARIERRRNIAKEILETEEAYVTALGILQTSYKKVLEDVAGTEIMPKIQKEVVASIFSNIDGIIPINKHLLRALHARITNWSEEQLIGDIFLKMAPYFKMYNEYGNNYEKAIETYDRCMADPQFKEQMTRISQSVPDDVVKFESLLIMPVQRIPRYNLLLRDLIAKTKPEHEDYNNLTKALTQFESVMSYLDKNINESANMQKFLQMSKFKGGKKLIQAHRVLITEGVLFIKKNKTATNVQKQKQKGFGKLKKFAKVEDSMRGEERLQLWLFNDVLVHLKASKSKSRTDVASTKYTWPLQLIWLKDIEEEDVNEPKMPYSFVLVGPLKTYTLKFAARDEKQAWMAQIASSVKNVLTQENAPDELRRYGAYKFPKDGGEYDGWWKFGRIHGRGVFKFFGNRYTGQWEYNCKSGMGKFETVTGETYVGDWKEDKPDGHGRLDYNNKAFYEGEWREGMRSGKGILQFSKGDKYDGEWAFNVPNGEGTYTTASGLIYKGGWQAGQMHGYGILVTPNGKTYQGEFRNGAKEGEGKMNYATGDFFIGQWKNDKKYGFGIYHSTVEGVYEGFYVNDLREGAGKMMYKHGNVYDGNWKRHLFHGQGILDCVDGGISKYDGNWEFGKHQGKGHLFYRSGARYEGLFKEGKPHGNGVYTSSNSVVFEGKWIEGRREGKATISVGPNKFSSNCQNGMMAEGERSFLVVPDIPAIHFEL